MFVTRRDDLALLLMTALCLASVMGGQVAEFAIGIGAVLLFLGHGRGCLDLGRVPYLLRRADIWLLIAAPLVLQVSALLLAGAVLPEYLLHLRARAGAMATSVGLLMGLGHMAVLAIVEEVAWRGYFQQVLTARLRGLALPAIVITAGVCAVGQFSTGSAAVIVCDLVVAFLCGCLYGALFYRTNSAIISAGTHLAVNLLSAVLLLFAG